MPTLTQQAQNQACIYIECPKLWGKNLGENPNTSSIHNPIILQLLKMVYNIVALAGHITDIIKPDCIELFVFNVYLYHTVLDDSDIYITKVKKMSLIRNYLSSLLIL